MNDALAESKYLKRFEALRKCVNHGNFDDVPPMTLKGDMILVERLPKLEMKTKSGIIIADAKTHKETAHDTATEFGIVLMVGPGQIFEDGSLQPCDSKPGDVILLSGNIYWYSQFGSLVDYKPYSIGRLRDSQVAMWFTDYKKAFEVLNG